MHGVVWLGLLLLGGCVPTCAGGKLCAEQCASDGLCTLRSFRAGDALYACYAASDDACEASSACTDEGRCFVTDRGDCRRQSAVAAARCAGSPDCTNWGQCTSQYGLCWADSDADCAASFNCRTVGRCHADGGACVPRDDADCAASIGCELEGACARFSYFGMAVDCRVPLDDPSACERSWICAEYGRCEPGPPEHCADCTRYGFCTQPGVLAPQPCTPFARNTPACRADGRCARDPEGECRHVPSPGAEPAAVSSRDPVAGARPEAPTEVGKPTGGPAPGTTAERVPETAAGIPGPDTETGPPTQRTDADEPRPTPATPAGPGAVAYDFTDIAGDPYAGTLTYASVLTGIEGFTPAGAIDTLVLRTLPEDTCRPRSRALLPLDAVWFLFDLPDEIGAHELVGGFMPGQASAKTWVWDGTAGISHNFGVHGTLFIESRTPTEVRGRVEIRAREYIGEALIGSLTGPFVAHVIDCSTYEGGWSL